MDQVRDDDGLERSLDGRKVVGVSPDDSKLGVAPFRQLDHRSGKVRAYAQSRFQRRKKVAPPAADFEDASARRNKIAIECGQTPVISAARTPPEAPFFGYAVPVRGTHSLTENRGCAILGDGRHAEELYAGRPILGSRTLAHDSEN